MELLFPALTKLYLKVPTWREHRRAKNYVAKIVGLDEKYTFQRIFIKIEKMDGEHVFFA